jgi:glycosyltransferase involved in cell wall biosynthesis
VTLSAPALAAARAHIAAGDWRGLVISRAYLLPLLDHLPPAAAGLPVLVDLDDDDAALCRDRAAQLRAAGDADAALWLEAEADAFETLIARHAGRVARFTAASAAVADGLRERLGLAAVAHVPNAVVLPASPRRAPVPGRLVFVGNLGYAPNVEGLLWFLAEVWPRLHEMRGDAELVVAGSAPAPALCAACAADGVTLVADPEALDDIYAAAAAAVVPLRVGSGSRIKILEAAAHEVPVIATAPGLAGIEADATRHLVVAPDEADTLSAACRACLDDPDAAARRARAFREFVAARHDRDRVIAALAASLREVMP